jgi:hypothetical protein
VTGVDTWDDRDDRDDPDEAEDAREIAHFAWVLATTLQVATAATPAAVHRALQTLAAGGVEPSRHTIRQARERLHELVAGRAAGWERSDGG